MTMPKFEAVAWRYELKAGEYTFAEKRYFDEAYVQRVIALHTAEQLAGAYEAGKRDEIPEWQPIDTAPKDGTAFRAYADELIDLDFNPGGSVEAACDGEEFIGCIWNGQQDAWYGKTIYPTLWMPLPAAPKGEE